MQRNQQLLASSFSLCFCLVQPQAHLKGNAEFRTSYNYMNIRTVYRRFMIFSIGPRQALMFSSKFMRPKYHKSRKNISNFEENLHDTMMIRVCIIWLFALRNLVWLLLGYSPYTASWSRQPLRNSECCSCVHCFVKHRTFLHVSLIEFLYHFIFP